MNFSNNSKQKKEEVKSNPKVSSAKVEEMIDFENLIDINKDNNLIDFSQSSKPRMTQPGHRFMFQNQFPSFNNGVHARPIYGFQQPGMFYPQQIPRQSYGVMPTHAAVRKSSAPRKPSGDLLDFGYTPSSKKLETSTEDFFKF